MQGAVPSFGFTSRHRTSVRNRLGSEEGAPASSVRRKRQRVGRNVPSDPAANLGPPPFLKGPPDSVVEDEPSEVFVILRQWGADVSVAVLPPLYRCYRLTSPSISPDIEVSRCESCSFVALTWIYRVLQMTREDESLPGLLLNFLAFHADLYLCF